jgi:hypothetical protein
VLRTWCSLRVSDQAAPVPSCCNASGCTLQHLCSLASWRMQLLDVMLRKEWERPLTILPQLRGVPDFLEAVPG